MGGTRPKVRAECPSDPTPVREVERSNPRLSRSRIVSTSKCVLAVTLCAAALCASCDSPTPAQPNEPLLGLAQASATDSAGRPVPPGGTTAPTPGHVRGVVRTSELTRPGTDTLVN